MVRRTFLVLAIFVAMFVVRSNPGQAQETSDTAVEQGREALASGPRYPWYDREKDSLRSVEVQSTSPENRPSDWEWREPELKFNPKPIARPAWLSTLWEIFGYLVWLLVIVGVLAAIYYATKLYLRSEDAKAAAGEEQADGVGTDAERIERLPFAAPLAKGDYLDAARQAYERGDFRHAIILLYSYLLMQLDKRRVVRLARGKTNRQYLREVRRRPELQPMFEATMLAFEEVYFGDHDLPRPRFEACWSGLPQFQEQLEAGHAD